ncbi:Dam family site-specific DNA-(adenine-N6)-methyltransferase [Motilimonas pumila]|uniref:Site-specific DNA-methyltransferase (adenine-specific) n=1 Tax=Motilimonas pumila TaxID=2303987 RepID=A0A418YCW8_9GAMM|nr:Dam family site-specific DNA-(adenine-N6)-methyltransferase [Motilimonas pumila]RJG42348.1 Dam family site-specific DNA-(adenine-N6)-methyltransferase [Motilimonas pumila]
MRSALKWAGGKKKLIDDIHRLLPTDGCRRLVEPFVGGASVFLNLDFDDYLLVDMNHDLIGLFNSLKSDHRYFITEAKKLFNSGFNSEDNYYQLRNSFNQSQDVFERAVIFLYLNRHGYNGLCRYNKSGGYNVPFGRYKKPYFPLKELEFFAERAQRATFVQGDFSLAFDNLQPGDTIYCDPPYSPINQTSNFTSYAGNSFTEKEQLRLVECAVAAREKGISTLISNHYVDFTKQLYRSADKLDLVKVQRTISRKGQGRIKVDEVMALYDGQQNV